MIFVPDCIEKGEGEVVLFLHGVGGGAYSWMPQINSFSMNYLAAAWNMPGYGKSPLFGAMSFPVLADALEMLLDDLLDDVVGDRLGIGRDVALVAAVSSRSCSNLARIVRWPNVRSTWFGVEAELRAARNWPRTSPEGLDCECTFR